MLLSCETGDGQFATQLAQRLGVPVTAPNGLAWSDSDGNVYASSGRPGEDGRTRPDLPPNGGWQTHRPNGDVAPAGRDGYAPGTRCRTRRVRATATRPAAPRAASVESAARRSRGHTRPCAQAGRARVDGGLSAARGQAPHPGAGRRRQPRPGRAGAADRPFHRLHERGRPGHPRHEPAGGGRARRAAQPEREHRPDAAGAGRRPPGRLRSRRPARVRRRGRRQVAGGGAVRPADPHGRAASRCST